MSALLILRIDGQLYFSWTYSKGPR